jgi:hypothetical protein
MLLSPYKNDRASVIGCAGRKDVFSCDPQGSKYVGREIA